MLRLILIIVVGVLALSFFGITIQSIVNSPAGQANFAYIWQLLVLGWNWLVTFLAHPYQY